MAENWKLTKEELHEHFVIKYGNPESTGWSPKRRLKFGYYQPGDIYEALIRKLVTEKTTWIDVGGGRALFPGNAPLSKMLAKHCNKLVAVDPSENVYDNPYAHEKTKSMFEDFQTDEKFDLATFRMVAEHITEPKAVISKLRDLLKPDGIVIIYTINKFSPIPLITYLIPFSYHHKIKNFFWGGEERDTFPVAYKMNTRKDLKDLFQEHQFEEEAFLYLDDLSAFYRFKLLNLVELYTWKSLKFLGFNYPENNLLGVYRRK
jgi:2-polyprenyl-3-methyl-5-hydroxy-6-metoxy-1,4-benzoquinol methylase